jgi:hypothetical protein
MPGLIKIEPIIDKFMTLTQGETLNAFAFESGFVKRKPKKIDPKNFLIAFLPYQCEAVFRQNSTYLLARENSQLTQLLPQAA